MQDLRSRLANSGFPDVSFRIIISKSSNKTETDGVDNLRSFAGDIPVIEESENVHSIWQFIFEGEVDHILVVDRCGRLAFQVISPWSLLSYPYVKAAILSTYNDDPCGPCDAYEYKAQENYSDIAAHNCEITDSDLDPGIPTTETVKEEITEESDGIQSTTPDTQTETTAAEEDNDRETVEMQETAGSSLHNTHNTNLSSTEELQSATFHTNTVINEKINPRSPATSLTEQSLPDNVIDADNAMEENELDGTLSPLTERKDGTIPIRVIMRSPHSHIKNGTVLEYEYLVLQTGNPLYHGHLESEENQDLVILKDKGHKKHVTEHEKKHKGKKYQNSRKPVESDERGDVHEHVTVEDEGNVHKKKIKHRHSEEIQDLSNEHKGTEIKKKTEKLKIQNPDTDEDEENKEKSNQMKKSSKKKIHNKVAAAESVNLEEESEDKSHHNTSQPYSSLFTHTQETRVTSIPGSESKDDRHKGHDNEELTGSNTENSHSSVSQDGMRENDKHHHSENASYHMNAIKDVQKPQRHHNKHRITVPVNADVNETDTEGITEKIKVNKKIHIGANTNNSDDNIANTEDIVTQGHINENASTQFIKISEVCKKKPCNKKHKTSAIIDAQTTTPIPLPVMLYNANNSNDSKPDCNQKQAMKGKLKPVFKNAYNTDGNENSLEDDDNLQRLQQVDVIANLGKTNARNKMQEETSSEENESEGKDENIIEHYSKLLRWIEYQL